MSSRFIICTLLLLYPMITSAQLFYPIVGTYNKKSAQGMAIWGDEAFLFNDGGHCRVLNLKSNNIVSEFDLASADANTHVATACFGVEILDSCKIPVIYTAEFVGKSRCFVEKIGNGHVNLVQTIEVTEKGKNYRIQCWLVDVDSEDLYSVSGRQNVDTHGDCPVVIRKYRLPRLSEGKKIYLTERDKRDEFTLNFPNCLQGATIKNSKLYIATGFQQSQSNNPRGRRSLKIIDLKHKRIIKDIDLTFLTTNEPEGLAFYNNKLLLFCGQEGGIYEIKY